MPHPSTETRVRRRRRNVGRSAPTQTNKGASGGGDRRRRRRACERAQSAGAARASAFPPRGVTAGAGDASDAVVAQASPPPSLWSMPLHAPGAGRRRMPGAAALVHFVRLFKIRILRGDLIESDKYFWTPGVWKFCVNFKSLLFYSEILKIFFKKKRWPVKYGKNLYFEITGLIRVSWNGAVKGVLCV